MPLVYTAIASGRNIIVDNKQDVRDFADEVPSLIAQCGGQNECFFPLGRGLIANLLSRNGLTVVCVADDLVSRVQCSNYLRQVFTNFTSSTDRVSRSFNAAPFSFQNEYQRNLALDASNFHMHAENTQLNQLRSKANEVVVIAGQNVEQLFQRQAKLENLDQQADQLKNDAQRFERTTVQVSRHYWWANMKMKLILGGVVFAILFTILMIILWQAGVFNGSSNNATTTTKP